MKILIISGAGVLAGTHLYNKLIKELIKLGRLKKDSDFPEIVLYNYPFSSISESGYLDEELAKKELKKIINNFTDFDHIIIACNTFHILDLDCTKILSLPGHVQKEIETLNEKSLVLCSPYSREKSLFAHPNVVYPNIQLSEFIDEVISRNIYSFNEYTKNDFEELNSFIKNENISHLVIGCTELSVIDWKNIVDIPIIDGANIVIKNLVSKIERKLNESL